MLASEVFRGDASAEVDAMQARAVRASRLAGEIGRAFFGKHFPPRETVTTAALLADVGLLLPDIGRLCGEVDIEGKGFPSHAEVGAYLLGMWGLPGTIVEAVAHHHRPQRVSHREFDTVGVVHVAVALSKESEPDHEYLRKMGVADQLPRWKAVYEADLLESDL